MKIYMVHIGETKATEITLEEAINEIEGNGFWKKGDVKVLLESGQVIHNPYFMCANSLEALFNHISA